jgi:hypothetical protein
MAGFFLTHIGPNEDRLAKSTKLREAFAELGFADPEIVEDDHYVFAAYPSHGDRSVAVQRYPNEDFVFICGTCLCDHEAGAAALLYDGIETRLSARDAIMGHYAAVIKKGSSISVVLDQFGGFHVFYDLKAGIVSSSFYAVCSALGRLTLSQQSACEYVFNGVVSGNETLFAEIDVAPIGGTLRIDGCGLEIDHPAPRITRVYTSETRKASLEQSVALLDRYVAAVTDSFDGRVGTALSGGYDSRLMLALLRRHGARPRVYVYGGSTADDVRVATEIAAGEGFPLEVIDKDDRPIIPPEEFPAIAHHNFLVADGFIYNGIFNNGAETTELVRRVAGNSVAFNGGGGEIFRNFFHLPEQNYTIRELLWSFYSQFDPSICTEAIDISSYYDGLERKVINLLGADDRRLPRPTVEWLYHSFRCRAWDGKTNSLAARYGATAMPYLETPITEHASALPLSWKNHGAYEAELIRRVDPRLAGYRSVYGHNFARPPPLSRRLDDYATYLRPPWLRRYTHRIKYVPRPPDDWPGYLARPYREAVLPAGPMLLDRLFRLDRVGNEVQFARIISLEYALRHFGARVSIEF